MTWLIPVALLFVLNATFFTPSPSSSPPPKIALEEVPLTESMYIKLVAREVVLADLYGNSSVDEIRNRIGTLLETYRTSSASMDAFSASYYDNPSAAYVLDRRIRSEIFSLETAGWVRTGDPPVSAISQVSSDLEAPTEVR